MVQKRCYYLNGTREWNCLDYCSRVCSWIKVKYNAQCISFWELTSLLYSYFKKLPLLATSKLISARPLVQLYQYDKCTKKHFIRLINVLWTCIHLYIIFYGVQDDVYGTLVNYQVLVRCSFTWILSSLVPNTVYNMVLKIIHPSHIGWRADITFCISNFLIYLHTRIQVCLLLKS